MRSYNQTLYLLIYMVATTLLTVGAAGAQGGGGGSGGDNPQDCVNDSEDDTFKDGHMGTVIACNDTFFEIGGDLFFHYQWDATNSKIVLTLPSPDDWPEAELPPNIPIAHTPTGEPVVGFSFKFTGGGSEDFDPLSKSDLIGSLGSYPCNNTVSGPWGATYQPEHRFSKPSVSATPYYMYKLGDWSKPLAVFQLVSVDSTNQKLTIHWWLNKDRNCFSELPVPPQPSPPPTPPAS